MTPIERFWRQLMEGRFYHIQKIYGTEAAQRYEPHPMEKEFFVNNAGRFTNHPEVLNYNKRFFEFCDERYKDRKQAYLNKIKSNERAYKATSLYKSLKAEREELVAYIRGITVQNAQGKETHPRTTQKESR